MTLNGQNYSVLDVETVADAILVAQLRAAADRGRHAHSVARVGRLVAWFLLALASVPLGVLIYTFVSYGE